MPGFDRLALGRRSFDGLRISPKLDPEPAADARHDPEMSASGA
jgi:hypothetical protein